MFWDILVKTYIAIIPALLAYIARLLYKLYKKMKANSDGTKSLLRQNLMTIHDESMEKGYIASYKYENFYEMYTAYHNLGGNGMIEHMKNDIDHLKMVKAGEKVNKENKGKPD